MKTYITVKIYWDLHQVYVQQTELHSRPHCLVNPPRNILYARVLVRAVTDPLASATLHSRLLVLLGYWELHIRRFEGTRGQ